LTRCGRDGEENWNTAALALATELGLPVLASNDVRFLTQDDFEAHEARVCINQGRVLADLKRPRDYSNQQYLKSPEEMAALFADLPEALGKHCRAGQALQSGAGIRQILSARLSGARRARPRQLYP
jgi:DNA polymerase-3 subunit alpha